MAMLIEPAGIIAPTEMSISPAIIRMPEGIATMPRLAAKFTQLAAPRNSPRRTPPKITKKAMMPTKPASGRLKSCPIAKLLIAPPSLLLAGIGERHLAERVVRQHRSEQKRADDDASEVRIERREIDALIHHREGDGAEDDPDDGAESARQKHAANDDAHDRIEDERLPAHDLRALIGHGLAHAQKCCAEATHHEERDGQTLGRNAGVARAHTVPAERVDPIPEGRDVQQVGHDRDDREPPGDGDLEHVADKLAEERL